MTHTPPVPPAATAPYPAHPLPLPHGAATEAHRTAAEVDPANKPESTARQIAIGVGVGIGSAAIVAALLFAGSQRKA